MKLMVIRTILKLPWLRTSAGWNKNWAVPSKSAHTDEINNSLSLLIVPRHRDSIGFFPEVVEVNERRAVTTKKTFFIMKTFCYIPVGSFENCYMRSTTSPLRVPHILLLPVHTEQWTRWWECQTAYVKVVQLTPVQTVMSKVTFFLVVVEVKEQSTSSW